jgi:hypothetical protein
MPFPIDSQEVRGAQFYNTVYRELHYTGRIASILKSSGLLSGNQPLGVWRYGRFAPEDTHSGLKNDCREEIDKYCGIMHTLGDRRLSTHLFQGLEILVKIAI